MTKWSTSRLVDHLSLRNTDSQASQPTLVTDFNSACTDFQTYFMTAADWELILCVFRWLRTTAVSNRASGEHHLQLIATGRQTGITLSQVSLILRAPNISPPAFMYRPSTLHYYARLLHK